MPKVTDKPVDITKCPTLVTAEIFGCSGQHLRNLSAKGAIKQTARGKYDLKQVASYMLQANEQDLAPIQKAKLDTETEKARRQKRINDEEDRKLIRTEVVEEFLHGYTGELLGMVEGIRKAHTALVGHDEKEKINKAYDVARTQMAKRFEAFKSDSFGIDTPAGKADG